MRFQRERTAIRFTAPQVTLSLEPMEMSLCEQVSFEGQPSWAERMLGLRNDLGPFRLAYLEAVLIAADRRASGKAERQGNPSGECK
jgi:CRISPR-associated endonuclease/helicase Cas3